MLFRQDRLNNCKNIKKEENNAMNQTISLKIAKTLLKRIYFVIGLFLISFNLIAKIELLDRVIAVVDSGIIMESQLNSRVEEILVRLKR